MKTIGKILHLARSGRLVIQLRTIAFEGQIIIDNQNTKIGRIMEIIGSVDKPYASVQPLMKITKHHLGKEVGINNANNDSR